MARKMPEKRPEEDNRYHDTWKLLKKYRDVTWSLEVSVRQAKNQFRIDYDCSIEDFLDSIYFERMTHKEIGKRYGRTHSTTGRHIQIILQRLQAELEGLHHEPATSL